MRERWFVESRVVISLDADWNQIPYPENFWTSLVAAGILKARSCPDTFKDVKLWWKEEREPDGNLGELIAGEFKMSVLKSWDVTASAPDIRLEAEKWVVVVETKLAARIKNNQFEAFERFRNSSIEGRVPYILMAPGSYRTGQVSRFYAEGRRRGVKAGFLDLALTANWAWDLLSLGAPAWGED
jgi:hypothetical protein